MKNALRKSTTHKSLFFFLCSLASALHGFDDADDDFGRHCASLPGAVGCNAERCPCDDGSGLPLFACSTATDRGAQRDKAGDAIGECVRAPSFYALVIAAPLAGALLCACCAFLCCVKKAKSLSLDAAEADAAAAAAAANAPEAACSRCGRAFGEDERFCPRDGAERRPAAAAADALQPPAGYAIASAPAAPAAAAYSASTPVKDVEDWKGLGP